MIDSIVKNVGQDYPNLFTQNIVSTFCGVFEKVKKVCIYQQILLIYLLIDSTCLAACTYVRKYIVHWWNRGYYKFVFVLKFYITWINDDD